jgi:hypothetical protein
MVQIIVGRPFEQGRRREFENPIEVCHSAEVSQISNILNARIALLIFPTDLRGAIGRSVIADHDFEICESLSQQAV